MFVCLGNRLCLLFAVAVPSLFFFFNSLFVLVSLGMSEVYSFFSGNLLSKLIRIFEILEHIPCRDQRM